MANTNCASSNANKTSAKDGLFFIDKRQSKSTGTRSRNKGVKLIISESVDSRNIRHEANHHHVESGLPKVHHDQSSEVLTFGIDTKSMSTKIDYNISSRIPSPTSASQAIGHRKTFNNLDKHGYSKGNLSSDIDPDSSDDDIYTTDTGNKRHVKVTTLQSSIDMSDTYINVDALTKPEDSRKKLEKMLLGSDKDQEIMKKSVVTADFEKKEAIPPYEKSQYQLKKERKKVRGKTAGKDWFDMPATELTRERRNDLMVLKMRHALDPKRFYKSNDIKTLPKYFQFGTIVETKADFYSSRIPKKDRKRTMVDELLADADQRRFNKRKYTEIQDAKRHGQGPYQKVKFPRRKKFNQKKKK